MPFQPDQPSSGKFVADEPKLKYERDSSQDIPASEQIGAFAYGAGTGLLGGLGELEKLGAYTLPQALGYQEKGTKHNMGFGRETLFPTISEVENVASKFGIEKPREELSQLRGAGEIIGGFGTSIPGLAKTGVKAVLGVPSKTSEKFAQAAEELGFKLSPSQVKQDVPAAERGATFYGAKNQEKANRLASKATGEEVTEISPDFIRGRLSNLGSKFDDLYKGKIFNIDSDAVNAIRQISATESALPGTVSVPTVRQTADNILNNFDRLATRPNAIKDTFGIEGEALQRMRNDLSATARSTSNRQDARQIYDLIDQIDASIARNHPDIAEKLNVLRPQYRSTVVLEDLLANGGIKQGNISLDRLGNMLGSRRGAIRKKGDLDDLGELGRELQLKARWESTGAQGVPGEDILKKALGTTLSGIATGTGMKSKTARALQRNLAQKPITSVERAGVGTSTGELVEPFQSEE